MSIKYLKFFPTGFDTTYRFTVSNNTGLRWKNCLKVITAFYSSYASYWKNNYNTVLRTL